MKKSILYFLLTLQACGVLKAQVSVVRLRCEDLANPLGIGVDRPILSWQLVSGERNVQQTAYQIIVSSSPDKLQKNEADVWNPGKQEAAGADINVSYQGRPLISGRKYYWKIKSFTNKGVFESDTIAYWTMGLLQAADWKAKWIGYDKASPWDSITQWSRLSARYLRKEFASVKKIQRATVYIAGLGLYELYINGKKAGDAVLTPAPTDYRKRVLYNSYDVTADIHTGNNAIAVVLGNGRFFTMRQAYKPQKINTFGYPKLLAQLEIAYTDGTRATVVSDASWKLTADGPLRTNNEYDGEEYDATKELTGWQQPGFDDKKWRQPELVKAPLGKLAAQPNPPMKIMKTIRPVAIKKINGNRYVMDMGQNFAGWVQLKVKGKKGDKIVLRFAESLQPDGNLYTANLRDARVTDSYTLKGGVEEKWHPSFVYHGFRYVEVSGYPSEPLIDDFEGNLVYDDLETIGSFSCSDTIINALVRNAWWGIASDYKGMPIDCPQRNERQPWLGDRATGSTGESFLFNNAALYAKWLNDIEESQTPEGAIPDVAPAFWNYYSDNVTWPGTYILVAEMLQKQFGNRRVILDHYSSMKKWMDYMKNKYMKNFIITKDKYGDWCVPPENLELIRSKDSLRNTNGELIATAYYYHLLQIMSRFALVNSKPEDAGRFIVLSDSVGAAFNHKFFNATLNQYDNNTVTANLLPLYFGMTPADKRTAVTDNIYKKMQADGMHISTGVIGTQWLMRGLTENGHADAAFALAGNTSYPSWGYMVAQGATTIWELWNGNTASPQMNSQNHVMLLGDLLIWLFEDLAGIKSKSIPSAFREITMKPSFVEGLNEVNAIYQSPYGKITSHWKKQDHKLTWNINIPANASALVYLPGASEKEVTESGHPLAGLEGVRSVKRENGWVLAELGSGQYEFESTIK